MAIYKNDTHTHTTVAESLLPNPLRVIHKQWRHQDGERVYTAVSPLCCLISPPVPHLTPTNLYLTLIIRCQRIPCIIDPIIEAILLLQLLHRVSLSPNTCWQNWIVPNHRPNYVNTVWLRLLVYFSVDLFYFFESNGRQQIKDNSRYQGLELCNNFVTRRKGACEGQSCKNRHLIIVDVVVFAGSFLNTR